MAYGKVPLFAVDLWACVGREREREGARERETERQKGRNRETKKQSKQASKKERKDNKG